MITFKEITPHDSPSLLQLKLDAISGCSSHHSIEDIEKWRQYCENEDSVSCFADKDGFVALSGEDFVGFVTYSVGDSKASIDNLFSLCPGSSDKIGTKLLQFAEKEIASRYSGDVFIRSTLNAVKFYKKHGYVYVEDVISRAGFSAKLLKKATHHPS